MIQTLHVASPAKLNLFLHITGRRENGYHELQTIFQLIDLCDELSFQYNEDDLIQIKGLDHVELENNLIYRAAMQLKPFRQHGTMGCHIQLKKTIPMGAGLGGGSSNAATTLLVLNQLWQCQLSKTQLMDIASKLGADVPIFVSGHNAWAEGIGEKITPLYSLPKKRYIILKPDCFISTQSLFSQKTLTRDSKPSKFAAYQDNPSNFGNNFEPLARQLYPAVEQAFQYLNQYGQAKLTGTGACVFIEIADDLDTTKILKQAPCTVYVAHSLNHSPVLDYVNAL
ncbi:4-(cytidine 5'-diphospho)-2-C-methyl-D-erythritol kinase [Acinetobacter qingfengensis]|uniref:4-diphosphocytidyl-2-C-methyl-D-erythritol kinase n=1 Tax=Acinetobacter qingfengensis TaxID=1262585 RepID=A0A1E7RFE5_9GAMM|nr:4-(cytidine 5'-diphospho)-2-C-methyl-D-erythritol kinase [Acinetobacter qingfengensis]KAA8732811.1 4-(cytidine 5'-diphospho)-2-C-methyl-D-erythritol kinase [Acinetobacter qingfengensis]OEY98078.1 4-(cytidine 5'-diphospho)-2-C-methyl-D-erythritol kinase [Acinetobacter qingfengensis]